MGEGSLVLFVVVVPFLGVLIYLGTQGEHFAERNLEHARAQPTQLDEYVRETARWQRWRRTGRRDRAGEGAARQRRN